MIVPLALTLWFCVPELQPAQPACRALPGWFNYQYFLTDPAFMQSIINTLILVGGVLLITVVGGILLALLLDQPIFGQGIVRILVISPFFIMPPVAALIWKNMLMHPGYGIFARIAEFFGAAAGRLVRAAAAVLDHPDRRLAVAAVRDADPADRAAVAVRGAEGGRRDGRRQSPSTASSTSSCRTWPGRSPW